MIQFETPSGLHAAFDALLARALRQLRVYDHDLSLLDLDHLPRHALYAPCVWPAAGIASSCCSTTFTTSAAIARA